MSRLTRNCKLLQGLRRYLGARIPPAPEWHRKSPGVFDLRFILSLGILSVGLVGLAITSYGLLQSSQVSNDPLLIAHIALLALSFSMVLIILYMTQRYLWRPLTHVRNWALRLRAGNLNARLPRLAEGEIAKLARDINALADNFEALSSEMDQRVREQTEELARSNLSLEVLYDVAATLNMPKDLRSLLDEFMHIIRDTTGARAVAVRLLNDDGQLELVASLGLSEAVVKAEHHMPRDCATCGQSVSEGEVSKSQGNLPCQQIIGQPIVPAERPSMLSIPLSYRGDILGVYNLFLDRPGLEDDEDMENLLKTIGQHLGMAIGKARLDKEARRAIIARERSMLANELHDSLAQTLASLRFQVRVLDESLQQMGGLKVIRELEQVENSLEEAYSDLRQLIAHCREPDVEKGLLPSIEKLVSRFRKETGIHVFLQREWGLSNLPADYEMQVFRIIQEALSNVRKHSNANIVRILLRCNREGDYHVLVENDGDGFELPPRDERHPGEHIGLKIMEERARVLGGRLRIESEPGEGTRVELKFHYDPEAQAQDHNMLDELDNLSALESMR